MKVITAILFCGLAFTAFRIADAAEVVVHEYPDRIVVECDGSKDAPTSGAAQNAPIKKGSTLTREQWRKAYKARMRSKTQAVEKRLEARQSRWAPSPQNEGNPTPVGPTSPDPSPNNAR